MRGAGVGWMVAAAFAGGFAAQWLRPMPAAAGQGVPVLLKARAVSIVDEQGRERIRLAVGEDGPEVAIFDAQSMPRARLARLPLPGDDAYYGLEALDGESRRRFVCGAQGDGSGAGLGIYDGEGVTRVGLGAADEVGCGLALRNADDEEVLGAGAGAHGGADFVLKAPGDGREIWRASRQIGPN